MTTTEAIVTFNEAYPSISVDTLEELMRRSLFHLRENHWHFRDANNGATRRLDGRKFMRADNSGADWHKLIGLSDVVYNDRKRVMFVIEGSKDAIAAAELAFRFGVLSEVGIICALGSGYRPIFGELRQLQGRRVLLIGDDDVAGMKATQIVSRALDEAAVNYDVWNWSGLPGNAKDLYEVLTSWDATAGRGTKWLPVDPLSTTGTDTFFSSFSPQTLQPFNPSTTETEVSVTVDELVAPYLMTALGTGHEMSFKLARAIKPKELTNEQIDEIFTYWFRKSRPFLPKDADESKSLNKFYGQMQRVRFLKTELEAACARARALPPPFIPRLDGNEAATKVAALCRELQRNADNRAFICPVNVVKEFVPVRWASQANWLLHVLERHLVIECVDRGAPNRPGQKGKTTMWKYKLPV